MFHDLHTHFVEDLALQYNEYNKVRKEREKSNSSLLRKSLSLATSLYHFNEHIPKEYQQWGDQMYRECPDYELLRDVVNVSKHRTITRYTPKIASATDIYECLVLVEFEDEKGPYRDAFKAVFVTMVTKEERDLHGIIVNVMNYWINKLLEMQVLDKFTLIPEPTVNVPTRNEAQEDYDMGMIQGLTYDLAFKIKKYNHTTGKLEEYPKEIKSLEMNLYEKRTHSFTFTSQDGKKIEFDLELDLDEERSFRKLNTNDEKIQYAMFLAYEKGVTPTMEGKELLIQPKPEE